MATIFTHPIVPVAIALIAGRKHVSPRLMVVAAVASILPDADVAAFYFDIPYSDAYGHRGFTHSIAFSALVGLVAMGFHRYFGTNRAWAFTLPFIGCLSHAVLDALTDGGLGVAFLWPVSDARFFFPWTPIEVSPIGIANFMTPRGWAVIQSELVLIWLPAAVVTLPLLLLRKNRATNT